MLALERGLAILDAFNQGADTLSLADLARRTGLYKSTLLRLAASLQRFGYLQRLDDGRFRLGPAVFQLGRLYQRAFRLADVVVPVLRALVAESGETASFYVRDGRRDTCLHRVESPRPVRDAGVAEGDSFTVDDSDGSKLLSAFLGEPGAAYEDIRRRVLIVARPSRRIAGAAAVMGPVLGADGKLAGILLLSGPESRFTDEAVERMKALVAVRAAGLTRMLGGDPSLYDGLATPQPNALKTR